MNNVRNNIKKEFTIVPNALINDNNLSDRARFIFVYMASKPDDWTFYNAELSKSLKYAIVTLRKYIIELHNSGWITKERIRTNGLFSANTYTLNARPIAKPPCDVFINMVKKQHDNLSTHKKNNIKKQHVEKTDTLNNNNTHKKRKLIKNNLTKGIKILK